MAAPTEAASKQTSGSGPESPTTVKPFEMDDDDVQETGVLGEDGAHHPPSTVPATSTTAATTAPTGDDEAPPPKPPRPQTAAEKNELILKEAFPNIELTVIRAVLVASRGQIDPAFNALLGMSDPDALQHETAEQEAPPPQPPRPSNRAPVSQIEADELYARQIAEQFDADGAYEARTQNRSPRPYHRQATGLKPNEMYDREHSFIDDDLPVIQENLRKGFLDTQKKVNSWFTNLKKRIDGEYDSEEDESQPSRRQTQGPAGRSGEGARRSTDYERYDADPQVLSDDFAGIRLNPDGASNPGYSGNPNLYRPPPKSASPRPDGRKVAFKDGHEDMDDPYNVSPKLPPKDNVASAPSSGRASKWQPMSAVDPNPITEHDPFSLGDSEDERDAKDKGSKDAKMEDSERLKKATADAMADSLMDDSKKGDVAK